MTDHELGRMFVLDDAPGPARTLERRAEAAIIVAALVGAGFAPPIGPAGGSGGHGGAGASGAPGAGAAGVKAAAIGKLALIVGGGAAITAAAIAAWMMMKKPRVETIETETRARQAQTVTAPEISGTGTATATATDKTPAVVESPAVIVHVDPTPTPTPTPAHSTPHHVEPAVVAPAVVAPAPADLLALANAARGAHDWSRADTLYAQVAAMPNRLAADSALVADGQLRLEHLGDAAGAAKRFRAALAASPRGALAEDARWGLAEAERALGNAAAEADALADFLDHHADSPLAARARARQAELAKRSP